MNADAFGFVGIADRQRPARLHDQAHVALRRQHFAQWLPVAVGVGQVERRIHRVQPQRLQLRLQRLVMIDHVMRAHLANPLDALRARGGGNHRESGMPRQLDRDGAHATSAADDQQMPAAIACTVE
ncbi:UNVERIFIED_ORG: hypothetical protein ABIB63_002953 [Xanthomonas axonopodis]